MKRSRTGVSAEQAKAGVVTGTICFVIFLLLIAAVRLFDTAPIGPEGTVIGLSSINKAFHDLTGVNMIWYKITDALGIAAILIVVMFAASGLYQLITRRDLLKVDGEILALGVLYALLAAVYAFFEIVIVNYRPVIMSGAEHAEASFPSSHMMLVCVVMGSVIAVIDRYVRDKRVCTAVKVICVVIAAITAVGRLICGVHWLSDITAGLFMSAVLLSFYDFIYLKVRSLQVRGGRAGRSVRRRRR